MSDVQGLMAAIEEEAGKLRVLSGQVATELKRGAEAQITEIDILRPEILQGLAALNKLLLQCGHIPPPERPPALFPLTDRMRVEANRWRQCDQIIAQQVPPRPRALGTPRQDTPSQNSTAFTLLDQVIERADGLPTSMLARALHAAHRVMLALDRASEARFAHRGASHPSVARMAAALFTVSKDHKDADVVLLSLPEEEEAAALDTLTAGTLLIHPDPTFVHRADDNGCVRLETGLYVLGFDSDKAAALKASAELTGLGLPPVQPIRSDIWQDIFDTSAARGFYPSSPDVSFVA